MARYFYRCLGCLSVSAVDLQAGGQWIDDTACACGGQLELMGEVRGDRLIREEDRCPCDDRCTCARGPKCDCKCGGKNHGSQMVVAVLIDAGKAMLPPHDPRNIDRGKAYRAKLAEIRQWGNGYWGSGWIKDRSVWENKNRFFSLLRKSEKARTWTARDKALTAAVALSEELERQV